MFVGRFVPRKDREIELGEKAKMFTNVFIKNLPEELEETTLTELFEKYGQITSLKIMKGDDGKSKGFAFVSYEDPAEAEAAVEELNNKEMDGGKTMYVGRAQKKAERQAELKKKFEALKMERMTRYIYKNRILKLDFFISPKFFSQVFCRDSLKVSGTPVFYTYFWTIYILFISRLFFEATLVPSFIFFFLEVEVVV